MKSFSFPPPLGMQVGISTNLLLFFTHLMRPLLIFLTERQLLLKLMIFKLKSGQRPTVQGITIMAH